MSRVSGCEKTQNAANNGVRARHLLLKNNASRKNASESRMCRSLIRKIALQEIRLITKNNGTTAFLIVMSFVNTADKNNAATAHSKSLHAVTAALVKLS